MKSLEEEAVATARYLYAVDDGVTAIFRLRPKCAHPDCETGIALLEVSEDTPAVGVLPFRFPANPKQGTPYSTTIIQVTPSEYQEIQAGRLSLPECYVLEEKIARIGAATIYLTFRNTSHRRMGNSRPCRPSN